VTRVWPSRERSRFFREFMGSLFDPHASLPEMASLTNCANALRSTGRDSSCPPTWTVCPGCRSTPSRRLTTKYGLVPTQRLILEPEFELNAYGSDDAARLVGAGISDLTLGLRLRYEFRREFAPCFGVLWAAHFGDSAHLRQAAGETDKDVSWIAGIRAWF